MINPVMSFNVEFTLRLAERLRPYNLRWLEEPLPPHDIEGHAELKRAITWIPLATGEDHRGRHAFAQLIERRAIDIVQPDIGWSGGVTETMKIYAIAETAGIAMIPHGGAVSPWGQHVAMAAPESPIAECWIGSPPGIPLEELNEYRVWQPPKTATSHHPMLPVSAWKFPADLDSRLGVPRTELASPCRKARSHGVP